MGGILFAGRCNPRTAIYRPELIWEEVWKGRDTEIVAIGEMLYNKTKEKEGLRTCFLFYCDVFSSSIKYEV